MELIWLFDSVFISAEIVGSGARNNEPEATAINVSTIEDGQHFKDLVNAQKDVATSNQYWVAYVMGAFQGQKGTDHDPDDENGGTGTAGLSLEGYGSMVYLEFIRDRSLTGDLSGPDQGIPWDAGMDEKQVLVHELGHQFNQLLSWEDTVGIMRSANPPNQIEGLSGDPADNFFSEEAKKRIRESITVNQ